MAVLFCTDATFVVVIKSHLPSEVAIGQMFKSKNCQFYPSDFKDVDVIREEPNIISSQLAYLDMKRRAQ